MLSPIATLTVNNSRLLGQIRGVQTLVARATLQASLMKEEIARLIG
jgi:hypothetical protein